MNLASNERLRVIVLGYLVRGPMGGMAWHHLQYVTGLRDLGHEVHFLEDSDDTPWCCFDPVRNITGADPGYGLDFARRVFDRAGLSECWTYYDAHTARWLGPCAECVAQICADADLVLNLSCANPMRPWLESIPVRVLVDTDPAFTQIRNLTDEARRERCRSHNVFFSFGENIAAGTAAIPNDGFAWKRTRQPIDLDTWPFTIGCPAGNFITVMQWDSYPVREYAGISYGRKAESFEPYMVLPQQTKTGLEIALGAPLLREAHCGRTNGYLRDPFEVAGDPWAYQHYIQSAKAEFTVAKQGYVLSRSGWFSERSAAFLASGRPVVTQQTGFSDWMPCGVGVLPFSSPAEALTAIEEVNANYARHCRAAREIAAEYFDAQIVLSELLEHAMKGIDTPCIPARDP